MEFGNGKVRPGTKSKHRKGGVMADFLRPVRM